MLSGPSCLALLKHPSINKANSFIFFTIMGLTISGHNDRSKTNLHYLPDENNSVTASGFSFNAPGYNTTLFEIVIDLCQNTITPTCPETNGRVRCSSCKFKELEDWGSEWSLTMGAAGVKTL